MGLGSTRYSLSKGNLFKGLASGHPPVSQEGKARAWEQEDEESQTLLEMPLLSCQPGGAGLRTSPASLVCWRHLPWKPEAPGPGPAVPRGALSTARNSSMPLSSKPDCEPHSPSLGSLSSLWHDLPPPLGSQNPGKP